MKVHEVKSAKAAHRCYHCHENIKIGESYIWWKPIGSNRVKWHTHHGFPPRSELTSSDKVKRVYLAQEVLDNYVHYEIGIASQNIIIAFVINRIRDLDRMLDSTKEQCEEVIEEYQTSAENIRKKFGPNGVYEDCMRRAILIEEWLGQLYLIDTDTIMRDLNNFEFNKEVKLSYAANFVESSLKRIRSLAL